MAAATPSTHPSFFIADTFALLCWSRAYRWSIGDIDLHQAVDWLQDRAVSFGIEPNHAQATMAAEFGGIG